LIIGSKCAVKIDRDMVEHIAELAKLELTEDELDLYAGQLSAILDYAERLQALDTDNIPPTASVLPLRNVLRPDVTRPSLSRVEALAGSADTDEGQFRVEAVMDDL
jgi:aspartyl-tRNA(Asn)/glutamyl-tRNA(Gln) amidotransferase subunit C